ncbi:AimR family lysis-lysogeny pheromone receptor [Bacillus cereus]|uniref:AimR family lysis-lysogeny pheromone receptor n=1 Tax=Bacillus cereus TaxID=1396 RepID=UPI0018F65283|nr:AimR family lysis-lysogeny pheromone receptor [Bacillus cereus]MBJ8025760.1 hypothetical protein [Bacillus cereus]MBJ8037131.1 hypothetical protein [Bacillus cereus]
MKSLHVEVCELIDSRPELTYASVAEAIGVSAQYMSKFKKNGTINFGGLLKLAKVLSLPDQNFRMTMSNFCLKVDTTELIKQSFEYAAITRDIELLKKLIEKYRDDRGSIKEYVDVYEILYKYIVNKIGGKSLIKSLQTLRQPTDCCLRILMDIMKCYNYYFSKDFPMMIGLGREVEQSLKHLSGGRKDFILHCYFHRVYEILAPVYLRLNNRDLTRKYAAVLKGSNFCAKTVSDATYLMGMSYLLEDKQKCLSLLKESYELSKAIGEKILETEALYNLKLVELYYELENNQSTNNLDGIERLASRFYQKENEDFIVLFKAMRDNSNKSLHNCLKQFFSQGNYFFSSLSARELYKRGEDSAIIEWMMDYQYEVGGKDFEEINIDNVANDDFNGNAVCY